MLQFDNHIPHKTKAFKFSITKAITFLNNQKLKYFQPEAPHINNETLL